MICLRWRYGDSIFCNVVIILELRCLFYITFRWQFHSIEPRPFSPRRITVVSEITWDARPKVRQYLKGYLVSKFSLIRLVEFAASMGSESSLQR